MGKGEHMEDMGMTDLQFKSWLRQIIRRLEEAEGEENKEVGLCCCNELDRLGR